LADPGATRPRQLLGLPYFQFIRADVDLRKYWTINPQSDFAARAFIGIGLPLDNSSTLPLEKRYFVGGNNSLRGWLARQPGPGSFSGFGVNRFDQFGEIKLEFNAEYRFSLLRLAGGYTIQGALFCDAGNIWTLKDTVSNKQQFTNFTFSRSWKELAINTGFGIRMNFNFFIIRFDVGLKLHDPAFTEGNRWVIQHLTNPDWRFNQWQNELNILNPVGNRLGIYEMWGYNLGIGLPF
jgi:outer membrane protein assembly factor BamA